MDNRTMSGVLSERRMKSIVESSSAELLQRMKGIEELVRQNSSSGPSSVPTNSSSYKMFHHPSDGKFRRVPPGWVFPKGALLNAYQYWHWGDEVNGVHPIKNLEPCDLEWSEGRHKKDLEELSFLCGKLDEEAKSCHPSAFQSTHRATSRGTWRSWPGRQC